MISAWSAKEHPDGDGRQLREVIAPCIEWYMSERAKLIRKGGGYSKVKLSNADSPDGADFFCFLDYASMWQGVDRTTEQRAALYACHNSPHTFATRSRASDSPAFVSRAPPATVPWAAWTYSTRISARACGA